MAGHSPPQSTLIESGEHLALDVGYEGSDPGMPSPAEAWDRASTKRALDELLTLTQQYRSSKSYRELLTFVARFKRYSPFNAMLVHIQMPGAQFVLPPNQWLRDYGRHIAPGARPLAILQPNGPVMFVSDTYGARLPPEVERPFEARRGKIGKELENTIKNALGDGVVVYRTKFGSQCAGRIRAVRSGSPATYGRRRGGCSRYQIEIEQGMSRQSQYATLVHELGHLYCGHLGSPEECWWPDRRGLDVAIGEFEAESVAYMVCARAGVDLPSEEYLSGYVGDMEIPPISLDCVMKSAHRIEAMGSNSVKRKKRKKQ